MNAPKKLLVSILTLAAGLLGLAVPAAAENGSYGYFRVVEGSATVMQAGTEERASAEINQPVLAGDRIWVPDRSRIEVVLADRNIVRVDGGSELLLERLAASPYRDDRATVLRLLEGNLQLVVTQDSLGDELPRIETPNATIYPQNFGVYRITADREGWSEVVVRRGTAEVVTERDKIELQADERTVIDGDRYADSEVQQAGGFDPLERWGRELDDDYASADLRYVDDDLRYEAAPLARYGSWIDVEGSRYWRPRVAADWRPYWQGRWIYTPSGLTWISSEPWGWVPYHYGSWDYLPAYGWVWQPGYVFSPAWVYWYWGPSYVGWCPTGYYTHYYGPRFGVNFGFRFGVYGWAGGDWGHFHRWNFIQSAYFDNHHGNRHGSRDGYWDGHRNVNRFAVEIGSSGRGRAPLERGVITTDTKPLRPTTWGNHNEALHALRVDRSGRSAGAAELPDVTSFIARKPDLPATVARHVRADGNTAALDGTPLKPSTLGRSGRGGDWQAHRAGEAGPGAAKPGAARPRAAEPDRTGWSDSGAAKPRGASGEGVRPAPRDARGTPQARPARPAPEADGGAPRPRGGFEKPNRPEPGEPSSQGGEPRSMEKPGRPAPEADGGAPRPRRVEIDSKPRAKPERSSEAPAARERTARPAPESDGGAPRPERRPRTQEKPQTEESRPPADRDDGVRRYERPRQEVYVRPEPSNRDAKPNRYERPEPAAPADRYRQPEPRVRQPAYQGPEPSRRPDPPRWESGSESRQSAPRAEPSPRREGSSSSRQAEPQRSRGDQGSRSQSRERRPPPRDHGGNDD